MYGGSETNESEFRQLLSDAHVVVATGGAVMEHSTLRDIQGMDGWQSGSDWNKVVINCHLPNKVENYLARAGCGPQARGRFSRRKNVINLVVTEEMPALLQIKDVFAIPIEELPADLPM